jgi:hypothetical protein
MEYWNIGFGLPTLHHSNTPLLHSSASRIDRLSAIDDQRMSRDERRFVGN